MLYSAIILHSYGIRGQSEQRYNTSYKLIVIQIICTMSCDGIEIGIQKYPQQTLQTTDYRHTTHVRIAICR